MCKLSVYRKLLNLALAILGILWICQGAVASKSDQSQGQSGDVLVSLSSDFQGQIDSVALFSPSESDVEANKIRASELERRQRSLEGSEPKDVAARYSVTFEDVSRRISGIGALRNTYLRINSALEKRSQLQGQLLQLKNDTSDPRDSLKEAPPYSIDFNDAFMGTLEDLQRQVESFNSNEKNVSKLISALQDSADKATLAWSEANDAFAGDATLQARWGLAEKALFAEQAKAEVVLQKTFGRIRLSKRISLS